MSRAEEDDLMRAQMLYTSVLWAIHNRLEQEDSKSSRLQAQEHKSHTHKVVVDAINTTRPPKKTKPSERLYVELQRQVKQVLARY
jgi:hypothetical protein